MNEKEFLKLYDDYINKIYRYIYFRVNSEEEAHDLTSEVFLKSWAYLKKSESNNSLINPRAFIYQITRNLISDYYRQSAKKPLYLEEVSSLKDIKDTSQDLDIESIASGEFEKIQIAIKQIKPEYQEIIILRYIEELEITEIAQIVGKREGNVRVLISRALKALKGVLKQ